MKRERFLVTAATAGAVAALPLRASASGDMVLRTPTGNLFGTFEIPAVPAAPPLVLLIAGSGPTDRDGNNPLLTGKNDSLKLLALALAQRGIASLRYDKRGVRASAAAMPGEDRLRFDTYVDDAVAWVTQLRAQPRFSRIVIAGHSEGSLVGMVAAQRVAVDGFVSLEGAGRSAPEILREQLRSAPDALRSEAYRDLDALAKGQTVADVSPPLAGLFRPAIQPYLISWFAYDPARELAKLTVPVTIVQGSADIQVTQTDGDALRRAVPKARYVLVEGMNHVLKHAPDVSTPTAIQAGYTDPALPVEPAVVEAVAAAAAG